MKRKVLHDGNGSDVVFIEGLGLYKPVSEDSGSAAVHAIEYALSCDEGLAFLRCWFEGDFDVCRDEWEGVPDEVFIGADPLFKPTQEDSE